MQEGIERRERERERERQKRGSRRQMRDERDKEGVGE
jgi:hypothetical protein